MRLDYEGNPYTGGETALVVRYKAGNPSDYKIPFGGKNTESVDIMTHGDKASDYIATEQKPPLQEMDLQKARIILSLSTGMTQKLRYKTEQNFMKLQSGERIIGVYSENLKDLLINNRTWENCL